MARAPEDYRWNPTPAERRHYEALDGIAGWSYDDWCRDNGFASGFEKTKEELVTEVKFAQRLLKNRQRNQRIHHNPRKFIQQACRGELHPDDITRAPWHEACKIIDNSRDDKESRGSLEKLLLFMEKKAKFLFLNNDSSVRPRNYCLAIIRLNDRRGQWINDPYLWKPKSHNAERQFSEFVRYVLVNYPVPIFMDTAWFCGDKRSYIYRDAFIHIGSGKNLRTAKMPVKMTKMMVHHFLQAPDTYTIEQAILWAQIHALGGDIRLINAVLATRLGENLKNNEFWQSVFRFLIANPMLDRTHVGPIIDFIHTQKFDYRMVAVGPRREEEIPPPQPNFSMRGRTVDALLAQVYRWHGTLANSKAAAGLYFKRSGILEYRHASGKDQKQTWEIREILSGASLILEGREMKHCVASYAHSCAQGYSSIWSMTVSVDGNTTRRQTVEVDKDRVIVQCRGRQNRHPDGKEKTVLKDWAKGANLLFGSFVGI